MITPRDRVSESGLERAIAASRDYLLREYVAADHEDRARPDIPSSPLGYWHAELEADSTLESDYILFLYFLDPQANAEKIRKLANYIKSKQLDDGTWNIYPGGPGEISASVKAYFALKLAGTPVTDPLMVTAREAILDMGGADNVNSFTKIYLSFLNQVDWKDCPAIPPEIVLLPRFFYFNIYEMSYWSRAIVVPLSILYACRPRREVPPEATIAEIFMRGAAANNGNGAANGSRNGHGTASSHGDKIEARAVRPPAANGGSNAPANGNGHAQGSNGAHVPSHGGAGRNGNGVAPATLDAAIPRDPNLFSWRSFFVFVDRLLKLIERTPVKPLRSLALKRAEKWIVSRFHKSDGLGAIFPAMVNSVMAMKTLGYDDDHPHVAEGLEKLRELEIEEGDTIRLQPCLSPIWDTALAMNGLGEAGVPADDPCMVSAARWLVSKEARGSGDWQLRKPGVEASGWYFQFKNEFYPDVDDTAAVLMALRRASLEPVEGGEDAVRRGVDWVLSLQCSNGGWAAFDVDVDREALTQVPFADHNAMLDPACADITGRVLEMLGWFPERQDSAEFQRAIDRGVAFLACEQDPSGPWYGRWGVNYIYGTCHALKGLAAAGVDPSSRMVRRAVEWLLSCQNEDGGWGESCHSYEDPATKGQGKSTASQTAWALTGLIAAGEARSDAVSRGIAYLLRTQNADGSWTEDEFTGTGFPRVFYLKYHMYAQYFPLYALGQYRRALEGGERPGLRRAESRIVAAVE